MWVDAAGDDVGAGRVDHFIAFQILSDLFDLLSFDQHIRFVRAISSRHGTTFDDLGAHPHPGRHERRECPPG